MDERTDGAGPESEVEPTAEVEADTGTAPGEDGQTGGKTTRRRRLEQYERIVETVDDGVYVLDEEFDIVRVNDAVSELTGYSRSELVGANAALLATEETIDQAAAVSEALRTGDGSAATITTTIQTADGDELPVETRFSVYEFSDGSYGQVGVVRDIAPRGRRPTVPRRSPRLTPSAPATGPSGRRSSRASGGSTPRSRPQRRAMTTRRVAGSSSRSATTACSPSQSRTSTGSTPTRWNSSTSWPPAPRRRSNASTGTPACGSATANSASRTNSSGAWRV